MSIPAPGEGAENSTRFEAAGHEEASWGGPALVERHGPTEVPELWAATPPRSAST